MPMTGKESFRTINHCSVLRWVNLKIIWGAGTEVWGLNTTVESSYYRYFDDIAKTGRSTKAALKLNYRVHWQLTYGKRVDVDDHEVQRHGEGHGSNQP